MATSPAPDPEAPPASAGRSYTRGQRVGLLLGLGLGGGLIVASPFLGELGALEPRAFRLLGVAAVVAVWWVSEALPLGATSLLPAAALPLLGILPAKAAATAYMSPIILLLMCGFFLALAVERSGVHRRLALHVLLGVGTSPRRLVLGFATAAAALSMWISNTATALVMMPVALAIGDRAQTEGVAPADARAFALAILLGTGYGASVGGMGTPVGTPPNLIAMEALDAAGGAPFTFLGWLARSAPVVVAIVPIIWLSLTRLYPRVPRTLALGAGPVLRSELQALGPWRPAEVRSLAVFGLAALLWVTRPDLSLGDGLVIPGWASRFGLTGTHDGAVAAAVVVLACALPSGDRDGERLLPWSCAAELPWGLVLLFGAGIAISNGFAATGISEWVGRALAELATGALGPFVALVTVTSTFGTELMSNTALANIAMPILAATAKMASLDPLVLVWPAALACSCAFMLPSATGPNAIVFGSGRIRIADMVKAGFVANGLAAAVVLLFALLYFPSLRGG